ncbi:MAG: ABC transporter permease [Planctomycetota bacterium]|nr:ABC transporter permease [Planctomycetota bacterium]
MSRVWTVLKREYLENVRTKAFIIGLVLTPLWIGIVFFVPKLAKDEDRVERVLLVDETGVLAAAVEKRLLASPEPRFQVETIPASGLWEETEEGGTGFDRLTLRAGAGEALIIVLTAPALEKREPGEDENRSLIIGASGFRAARTLPILSAAVNDAVNAHLVESRGIDPEIAALLQRPAVRTKRVDESGKAAGEASLLKPLIFMMFLFMGIMGISQMLINSTLEEKSNRVYEVLLSSVSPLQLMSGKILGVCGIGFTLLLLWAGGGLGAAFATGLTDFVTAGQVIWLLVFYVVGFLFIASLMVAIGSACNTIKEAQNLMAPISILLAMPLILSMVVLDDPNGTMARVLSFIPPFTPFVLMARMANVPAPPEWEVWAAFALLLVSTWFMFRMAARVFRVGILLYGQPPSLKQIVKWMFRSPD